MLKRAAVLLILMVLGVSPANAGVLKVVATFLPVWIFTANVAGGRAEVTLLVPPGVEVHEFSLRPRDLRRLHEADLVVINGAGLERRFLKLPGDRRVVDTSRGVEIIREGRAADPHIWLDPLNAITQVENIRDALARADPENRAYYESNAGEYAGRLRALDEEMENGLKGLGKKHLITFHSAFRYFARRYGLVSYSLAGVEAGQPLPRRMKEVYDIVRDEGVRAVFSEERLPAGALKRLGEDLGVEVCSLNALGSGRPEPGYYEEAMRANLREILRCLGKQGYGGDTERD